MATNLNFKKIIDLPMWRPEAPALAATGAGVTLVNDKRNGDDKSKKIFMLRSSTALDMYSPEDGDWMPLGSPALAGTFGAGTTAVFHASQGPRGTLAAGSTSTVLNLTTALPAAVGVNQLSNRGDGTGFIIRVIGSGSGGSGKIEERKIVANTAGTTPVIILDSPLSFTPTATDLYEIVSGRIFMLNAGTVAAGIWKHYDVATNSFSGNLATTNLPATITTESSAIALSEVHVPYNRESGEGMVNGGSTYNGGLKNCILATAATSTTITGSGMPSLATNEYRNFQIRIVEDTTNTTAVGQRRRISSNTSGATGVFTVAAWAVTPSATAKFVVENDDDKIILKTSANTTTYNYNITANTWDTSTWAAGQTAAVGMCGCQAFGMDYDTYGNTRQSFVYYIRGGNSSAIDVFDIAGGATGAWTAAIAYGYSAQTFTTGTCCVYNAQTQEGCKMVINVNGGQRFIEFNMKTRVITPLTFLRYPQSTAVVGCKLACSLFVDGDTKVTLIYHVTNSQTQMFSLVVQT